MNRIRLVLASLVLVFGYLSGVSRQFAIKSNLLSDIALSPNVGVELGLAPKWTLNASGQLNLWSLDGHKWRHWLVQPEARYWFCHRFNGHFLGVHVLGGEYNFGNINAPFEFLGSDFHNLKDKRYVGWEAGAGIGYGYAWTVGLHWNIEAELGIGWIYTRYDAYPCTHCGNRLESGKQHNYYGPTKAAINIVYIF